MDDVIVIELKSRTVFWTDLGFKFTSQNQAKLEKWWDAEVDPWMTANIKGHCNPHEAGVWFAEPEDAMLFKLVWAGQGPE